jgi:hypothetical protein
MEQAEILVVEEQVDQEPQHQFQLHLQFMLVVVEVLDTHLLTLVMVVLVDQVVVEKVPVKILLVQVVQQILVVVVDQVGQEMEMVLLEEKGL